jgi:hypothetical protein
MITARLLTILAASSLAAIAYAQTQPAPSNQPNAAPGYNTAHPQQRETRSVGGQEGMSAGSRSAPGAGLSSSQTGSQASPRSKSAPGMALATSKHSHRMQEHLRMAETGPAGHPWSSISVQSPSGQSLGSVSEVVPGLDGRRTSGYVLVSGANGESVPVPYRTASSMVKDGKLVLSPSRLEHAPRVTQANLESQSDHAWRVKADRYWRSKAHGHMSK